MANITSTDSGGEVVSLLAARARAPAEPVVENRQAVNDPAPPAETREPRENVVAALSSTADPLDQAARVIEELVTQAGQDTRLRINKDDDTGRYIYQSVDPVSGEVVGQFPPETIFEIISQFRNPEGLIVDGEA